MKCKLMEKGIKKILVTMVLEKGGKKKNFEKTVL
jgi:hypothetical protein